MKRLLHVVAIALVAAQFPLGARNAANATFGPAATHTRLQTTEKEKISPEERLIRSAYEKLMRYHKVTVLYFFNGRDEDLPKTELLEFTLNDFRVGSIDEIKDRLIGEFLPPPSGEVLDFVIGRKTVNGGPEEAHYKASWTQAQQHAAGWFKPRISDLYTLEPTTYFDVGRYATYEVTVRYKGKAKTYKAAALFHNLYESAQAPRPEFWDYHIQNGALGRVLAEKAPPYTGKDPALNAITKSGP